MIPILYESTESTFTTNGIGRLADAITCVIREERNGIFELTMTYPMAGIHFAELAEERILYAQPRPGALNQAFRIYEISRPIGGIVTVNARHISYQLAKTVVMPFTAGSCAAALAAITDNVAGTTPFTFWTDKTNAARFNLTVPSSVRSILGGQTGSILDVYGTGEYEWDMYTVKLHLHRGQDRGVTIRYGKNLTDLKNETNSGNVYTAIVPYYASEDTVVTLPEKVLYGEHVYDYSQMMIVPVDLTSQFQNAAPTVEQLRAAGQNYLAASDNWKLSQNIEVSFVDLSDTEEYKNIATLQRVNLCDTVTVIHPKLGVEAKAKVIKVEYNVLAERYNKIELGDARTNLAQAVIESSGIFEELPTKTFLQSAIEHATQMITGGLGGYIRYTLNANGEPEELLIMDTPDKETAVNVWRWNMGGLGHSHSGYDGPFDDVALTQDGQINANMITSGIINANLIKTGIIRDQTGENFWNLVTGEMHISAEGVIDTSNFVTKAELQIESDKIAAEVVEQVGSGIFYNCDYTDNGDGTTTINAHVYLNRNDSTSTFDPEYFLWYKKTEDGQEYIGSGYTITVENDTFGYGGEVVGVFLMLDDAYPVTSQGRWVFTNNSVDTYPVFGYDYA